MGVRIDRILMSSLHESFKNYKSETKQIVISGAVPPGGKDFGTSFSYSRAGTIADIYISKVGTNSKRLASYGFRVYEFIDADLVANIYLQYTPSTILVNIYVANPDVISHTPTTQTFDIQAVIFDAPIAN